MIGELGRMPEENEEVVIGHIRLIAEEIEKNRILKVRMFIENKEKEEGNARETEA